MNENDSKNTQSELIQADIYYVMNISSDNIFLPPNTSSFELVSDFCRKNGDGVVVPGRWRQDASCRAFFKSKNLAYPQPEILSESHREVYLQIPDGLMDELQPFLEKLSVSEQANVAEYVEEIRNYFLKNYKYQLGGYRIQENIDPVLSFLNRRTGHCELFASAAVLMLRAQGVPARYVTGFVTVESGVEGIWQSRVRDAHAWVEAYDEKNQIWILVEATPTDGIPALESSPSLFAILWQRIKMIMTRLIVSVRRGEVAEAIVYFFASFFKLLYWIFSGPIGIILILLFLFRVAKRCRIRTEKYRGSENHDLELCRQRLMALLRKNGFMPGHGETLRELEVKIQKEQQIAKNAECCEFLLEYQMLRFNPERRSPEKIQSLKNKIIKVSKI